ncbi:hypothetical protein ACC734_39830, partial [Rhizobium ruizarguesonis]
VLSALILSFGGSEIMTMLVGVSPTLCVPEWIRFGFLGAGGALILVILLLQVFRQHLDEDIEAHSKSAVEAEWRAERDQ